MRELQASPYERAFENWLIDRRIEYVSIDEQQREVIGGRRVKSFDFLLRLSNGRAVMVELKGRTYHGTSLQKITGFECWVTAEDVDGLARWQQKYGAGHEAVFVFAYRIMAAEVDSDGRELFEFGADRYVFFCIRLEDYRRFMKRRSPKWRTVTLPAAKFRACARDVGQYLR